MRDLRADWNRKRPEPQVHITTPGIFCENVSTMVDLSELEVNKLRLVGDHALVEGEIDKEIVGTPAEPAGTVEEIDSILQEIHDQCGCHWQE
jgi:hypothetical protein